MATTTTEAGTPPHPVVAAAGATKGWFFNAGAMKVLVAASTAIKVLAAKVTAHPEGAPPANKIYVAETVGDMQEEQGQLPRAWVHFSNILSLTRIRDMQGKMPLCLKIIHSGNLQTRLSLLKTGGSDAGNGFSIEMFHDAIDEHILLCRLQTPSPTAPFGISISKHLRVTHINEESIAASSGLEVGDILLSINNVEIQNVSHLQRLLQDAGSKHGIKIRRRKSLKNDPEAMGFERLEVMLKLPPKSGTRAETGLLAVMGPESTIQQATRFSRHFGICFCNNKSLLLQARISKIVVSSIGASAGLAVGDVVEKINHESVVVRDSSLRIDDLLADDIVTVLQIRRPFSVVLRSCLAVKPTPHASNVLKISQHLERYAGIQCHDVFIRGETRKNEICVEI
jgi:membrane-associated protease RseP (regulator of RpoE activity)